MGRPYKGQHKIPRTYLEAFTNSKGIVWVADKNYNLYPQKPVNILKEADYYTVRFKTGGGTLDIETKFLGGIEGNYARIYKEKLTKSELLSEKEKATLSIFVASMMSRQPVHRESMERFFAEVERKIKYMRGLPDHVKKRMSEIPTFTTGPTISANEMLEAGKDVGSLHSSLIPDTVIDTAPIIFDMKWCFLVRTTNDIDPFITSDNPFIMLNPEAENKFGRGTFGAAPGLIQKNVEITLPLSSDIVLLCGWKLKFDCEYLPVHSKDVRSINHRTMRHATTLISSDKDLLKREIASSKNSPKNKGSF
jgi:hypothetical protein